MNDKPRIKTRKLDDGTWAAIGVLCGGIVATARGATAKEARYECWRDLEAQGLVTDGVA